MGLSWDLDCPRHLSFLASISAFSSSDVLYSHVYSYSSASCFVLDFTLDFEDAVALTRRSSSSLTDLRADLDLPGSRLLDLSHSPSTSVLFPEVVLSFLVKFGYFAILANRLMTNCAYSLQRSSGYSPEATDISFPTTRTWGASPHRQLPQSELRPGRVPPNICGLKCATQNPTPAGRYRCQLEAFILGLLKEVGDLWKFPCREGGAVLDARKVPSSASAWQWQPVRMCLRPDRSSVAFRPSPPQTRKGRIPESVRQSRGKVLPSIDPPPSLSRRIPP